MSDDNRHNKSTKQFLNLLMANQGRILSYIGTLVPNYQDADDIMQETASLMWEKFDQYEIGTDFAAWGVKIAYYNVLRYRRKKGKEKIHFSDQLFEQVREITEKKCSNLDQKVEALHSCIKKLEEKDRSLLRARYELNQTAKSVAQRTGKSLQTVYRSLGRVHHILYRCINRFLSGQGVR